MKPEAQIFSWIVPPGVSASYGVLPETTVPSCRVISSLAPLGELLTVSCCGARLGAVERVVVPGSPAAAPEPVPLEPVPPALVVVVSSSPEVPTWAETTVLELWPPCVVVTVPAALDGSSLAR